MVAAHCQVFLDTHAYPLIRNGELYIDWFFLLSGFVMAHAYGGRIRDGLGFRAYLLARLGRLYPLHLVLLIAWIPLIALRAAAFDAGWLAADVGEGQSPGGWLQSAVLWYGVRGHEPPVWNFPSWSVSVEFHAYLLFFVAARWLAGFRGTVVPVLLALASYGTIVLAGDGSLHGHSWGLLRAFGGFFGGVAAYRLHHRLPRLPAGPWRGTLLEGLAVGLVLLLVWYDLTWVSLPAFVLMILVLATGMGGLVGRLLHSPPLQFLGRISYSIYLVHALVLLLAGTLLEIVLVRPVPGLRAAAEGLLVDTPGLLLAGILAAVVALSALTWRFVERPGQALFRHWAGLGAAREGPRDGRPGVPRG